MSTLPAVSQGDLTSGLWFVFPQEDGVIRVWISSLSGMEKIYVDDTVVSERRSISKLSIHDFSAFNTNYSVEIRTISIVQGTVQCTLVRDGVRVKSYQTRFKGGARFSPKRIAIAVVIGATIGAAGSILKLPVLATGIISGLVAVLVALNSFQKRRTILIEETA